MPVERELKFVLRPSQELIKEAEKHSKEVISILQFYLTETDRFRSKSTQNLFLGEKIEKVEYFFTFKKMIRGKLLEIETEISEEDFYLAKLANSDMPCVQKNRYIYTDGMFVYEIDLFFGGKINKKPHFAMMEIEAINDEFPLALPVWIEPFVELKVPEEHNFYFTNKKLMDAKYASTAVKMYMQSHT